MNKSSVTEYSDRDMYTAEEKIVCLEKKSVGEAKEEEDVVLPGFRFHPTDEELVGFYLRRKVDNKRISMEIIKEIDVYKYDPWDLPRVSSTGGEKEWYFFCLRGRKYRNSVRPNRVTGSGFWKATGIDKPIYSACDANDCIGLKKSLVYYRGSAGKGNKTDWMMHEFRLPSTNKDVDGDQTRSPSMQEAEIWTICRIFQRNASSKKYTQSNLKQAPTDSSTKTSSFESDTGEYDQHKLISNYIEEKNQLHGGGQWNPTVLQAPFANSIASPNPNLTDGFLTKEAGNWDELGVIMDCHMMDQSVTHI